MSEKSTLGMRYSQLSDSEVLRRVLMLGKPKRASMLLRGGLVSFLWANASDFNVFSLVGWKKIAAAQYMIRRFTGSAAGKASLKSNPEPVVRFLFLNESRPDREVRGLLFLDENGRGLGTYTLDRPCPARLTEETRGALQAAMSCEASYIVLFHIRPGGAPDATGQEAALTERLLEPARVLGMEIIDSWIITGCTRWRSLGPRSLPATPLLEGRHFVGNRVIPWSEVCGTLDTLLYQGKRDTKNFQTPTPEMAPVRELVEPAQSFRDLAGTPPDDFHHPGLSHQANQALAATLELTRRLGQAEVPCQVVTGGPEWLAHKYFPEIEYRTYEQMWLLGLNQYHRVVARRRVPTATRENSDQLSRLSLQTALQHQAVRLVAMYYLPESPPRALDEMLTPQVMKILSAVGVRCDGYLGISADGSWSAQGRSGKLQPLEKRHQEEDDHERSHGGDSGEGRANPQR